MNCFEMGDPGRASTNLLLAFSSVHHFSSNTIVRLKLRFLYLRAKASRSSISFLVSVGFLMPGVQFTLETLKAANQLGDFFTGLRPINALFAQFCYHLPFSRMGEKAHRHLASLNGAKVDADKINPGLAYSRQIGNCYSAALYLSLISALESTDQDLTDKPIALFSYGSGAVAEFFSGVIQPGYRAQLFTDRHQGLMANRAALSYDQYVDLWHAPDPQNGEQVVIDVQTTGTFRLAKIETHKRHYEIA